MKKSIFNKKADSGRLFEDELSRASVEEQLKGYEEDMVKKLGTDAYDWRKRGRVL